MHSNFSFTLNLVNNRLETVRACIEACISEEPDQILVQVQVHKQCIEETSQDSDVLRAETAGSGSYMASQLL